VKENLIRFWILTVCKALNPKATPLKKALKATHKTKEVKITWVCGNGFAALDGCVYLNLLIIITFVGVKGFGK